MLNTFLNRMRKMRELRRNATLTRAELEAAKLAKFRDLVQYVNTRAPYYARLIQELGIDPATALPGQFPVLTKSLLMNNFDEIVTDKRVSKAAIEEFLTRSKDPDERYLDHFTVIHTSGSSGEVGYFVYAPEDLARGLAMRRQGRGNQPKIPRKRGGRYRLAFFGATDGHYAGVTMMSMTRRGLMRLFLQTELLEVNSPLPGVIARLNAFQPDVLIGYTTALKILAEKQREGLLQIGPQMIGTAGEATSKNDKEVLQQAFGCGVMNTYGCSEHLGMGGAMPGSEQIVLYDDDLMFEFRDDHTLITNLFNRTLPLIRYRMSDALRPVQTDAHKPYLVIENLIGRNELQPIFINRDGVKDFISPHTINEMFVTGVTRFQLHLLSDTRFRFMVSLDSQLSPESADNACAGVAQRLREILAAKHMENVQFDVVKADDLPVSPVTRKFQLIIDARQTG